MSNSPAPAPAAGASGCVRVATAARIAAREQACSPRLRKAANTMTDSYGNCCTRQRRVLVPPLYLSGLADQVGIGSKMMARFWCARIPTHVGEKAAGLSFFGDLSHLIFKSSKAACLASLIHVTTTFWPAFRAHAPTYTQQPPPSLPRITLSAGSGSHQRRSPIQPSVGDTRRGYSACSNQKKST